VERAAVLADRGRGDHGQYAAGVAQLGFPGQLVEIDVTAALLAATC
jgi:hypothetical protein